MKTLIQILMAIIFSSNSFAAYWSPNESIPITIDSPDGTKFTLGTPAGTQYEKGATYFFQDGENWIRGTCIGNENGESQWAHMEYIPDAEQKVGASSAKQVGFRDGFFASDTHGKAVASATTTGIAHALYRGLVYTDEYRAEMNRLQVEAQGDYRAAETNYKKIREGIIESQALSSSAVASFENALKSTLENDLKFVDSISYESSDESLVNELKELETILTFSRSTVPKRVEARKWGLRFVKASDQYSAQGLDSEAQAMRRYSEVFADIAIGFDPVTGVLRDTYEAFTGKNFVTGEDLDEWSRGFAVVGALSFGFGSKIGKGLKAIRNIVKATVFEEALSRAARISAHIRGKSGNPTLARNRAQFEKYLNELRQNMKKPVIKDSRLKELVDWYWRREDTIGNGSTAAAVRFERLTGRPVKGSWHSQKANDARVGLKKWLDANPSLKGSDREAAENILKDLDLAIGGE